MRPRAMSRIRRAVLIAGLLAVSAAVSGCSSGFDVDKLDVFGLGNKPKLPGERKPLFPEGVPGVSQGVPSHLVKGNQPTADTALTGVSSTQAAAAAPPNTATGSAAASETGAAPRASPVTRARSRPKPNVVRAPSSEPAGVTVQPASQPSPRSSTSQASTGANQAPWPAPSPQATGANAPWPSAPSTTTAPWPDAPAPGTFSR